MASGSAERDGARGKSFYEVMGISPDATPDDIKRAYRKLALRYHPDKNPDAGELFQKISAANATLSDPQKRQVYDRFGDQGVQMLESMAAHGVPKWLLTPAAQGGILCSFLLLLVLLFVALPILVLMRIDGATSASWLLVLIPLWLADGLLLAVLFGCGGEQEDEERSQKRACDPRVKPLAVFVVVVVMEVLLALKLDDNAFPVPWSVVFAPIALTLLYSLGLSLHARFGTEAARAAAHEAGRAAAVRLLRSLLATVLHFAFWCLLGLKLDSLAFSWWPPLLPLWLLLLLHCYGLRSLITAAADAPSKEEKIARRVLVVLSCTALVIAFLSLFLLTLQLCTSLELSATLIATPLLVIVTLLLCCGCCGICCGAIAAHAEGSSDSPAGYGQQCDSEDSGSKLNPSRSGGSLDEVVVRAECVDRSAAKSAVGASPMSDVVDLGQQLKGIAAAQVAMRVNGDRSERSEADLRAMTIRQLKAELDSLGVAHTSAVEKNDLLTLALDALRTGRAPSLASDEGHLLD
mmetsp:Transcript_53940/g.124184  ORF Transcript_53940/g.124184 Transcript_53940/m.124184 type:complete len:521 (-) Transcript_53940:607-2169(-)